MKVTVRWWDGYLEMYDCEEFRFGHMLLWMRLKDGKNRHLPTHYIRWYSVYPESHENIEQKG